MDSYKINHSIKHSRTAYKKTIDITNGLPPPTEAFIPKSLEQYKQQQEEEFNTVLRSMEVEYEALAKIQKQISTTHNKAKHEIRVYDEDEESILSTTTSIPDLQDRDIEDDSTCNSETTDYQIQQRFWAFRHCKNIGG